jgi:hypothetical protein
MTCNLDDHPRPATRSCGRHDLTPSHGGPKKPSVFLFQAAASEHDVRTIPCRDTFHCQRSITHDATRERQRNLLGASMLVVDPRGPFDRAQGRGQTRATQPYAASFARPVESSPIESCPRWLCAQAPRRDASVIDDPPGPQCGFADTRAAAGSLENDVCCDLAASFRIVARAHRPAVPATHKRLGCVRGYPVVSSERRTLRTACHEI